ncbi:MAG TPA: hypothetical protein VEK57_17210 [Thermoanaerobaculia bacterium]|nr:hypothetical protein [Thermoanaerobaculia bacterium]
MSDSHVTRETLTRLRQHELQPQELTDALRHIGTCSACALLAAPAIDAADLHAAITTPEVGHLDPLGQLIPYVDRALDTADREIVESHLQDCAMCRAEVDDLRALAGRKAMRRWTERTARTARPAADRGRLLALAAAIVVVAFLIAVFFRTRPAGVTPPLQRPEVRGTVPVPPPVQPAPPPRPTNPRWERLVADAVVRGRLPYPADLAELDPPPDVLRGTEGSAKAELSPAGVVIDETRPELRWEGREGAAYVAWIYEGETEIARSGRLTAPRWRPGRALPRGRTYTWQVEVEQNGATVILPAPPAPAAMFRILTDEQSSEIRSARAQQPDDHLLHAVLFARNGQRAEAEAALRRAAAAGNADAKAMLRIGS